MKTYRSKINYRGFSLIELLVALVILAILAAIGMPSFRDMISDNRMLAQTQTLTNGIKLARSEAIKRGANVSICPAAKDAQCCAKDKVPSDCSTCQDPAGLDPGKPPFQCGWVVFIDNATPGVIDTQTHFTEGGDIIFNHENKGEGQVSINLKNNNRYIRFSSQGFLLSN